MAMERDAVKHGGLLWRGHTVHSCSGPSPEASSTCEGVREHTPDFVLFRCLNPTAGQRASSNNKREVMCWFEQQTCRGSGPVLQGVTVPVDGLQSHGSATLGTKCGPFHHF